MTLTALALWILASAGSTMILTNGSIFAPLREYLPEGKLRTLASCPMCSGFWLGVFWSFVVGSPSASLLQPIVAVAARFADGCASSFACELAVSTWLAVARFGNAAGEAEALAQEVKNAANLWRYVNDPARAAAAETERSRPKEDTV